ncbi:MAG: lytic transglycosylase domain-containing protein [Desulfotomaculales bacterium]
MVKLCFFDTGGCLRKLFLLALIFLFLANAGKIVRAVYPFAYRETINYYAGQYNIDPCFIAAVIKAESNFNPRAVSPRGARGLMQVMPETGMWAAQQVGQEEFSAEQLFNPEINIRLGSWYLADLSREFNGNPVLVLAAYNGGRANVREWLAEGNLSRGQDIDRIPFPETRQFIRKVLWNYRVYRFLYT